MSETPNQKFYRKNTKAPPDLNETAKDVKGYMKVLLVLPYRGIPVYIRQIGLSYFEYAFWYKEQMYSSYIIMYPEKGKKKLTRKQLNAVMQITLAGAHTTIEALLKIKSKGIESQKALAGVVTKAGDEAWGKKKK